MHGSRAQAVAGRGDSVDVHGRLVDANSRPAQAPDYLLCEARRSWQVPAQPLECGLQLELFNVGS